MIPVKIGLFPEATRQELNRRLLADENPAELAKWLNTLPEARTVSVGAPKLSAVTEQDIATWRQGGYRDWLAHVEAMAEVRRVVAEAKELSQTTGGALTDSLAAWLAGRYAIATRRLAAEEESGAVNWNLLRALCHDLVDLRRGDHGAESLRIERERLEIEKEQRKEDLEKQFWEWAKKNRRIICRNTLTEKERVNRVREILFDALPEDEAAPNGVGKRGKSRPESNSAPVKVNQAESR